MQFIWFIFVLKINIFSYILIRHTNYENTVFGLLSNENDS